jgi:hypothetical protein
MQGRNHSVVECVRTPFVSQYLSASIRKFKHARNQSALCCVGRPFVFSISWAALQRSCTEKPFRCLLWEKSFHRPSMLKQHWRAHTGEKPFSWLSCEKSFVIPLIYKPRDNSHLRKCDMNNFSAFFSYVFCTVFNSASSSTPEIPLCWIWTQVHCNFYIGSWTL